jgi:hypothetical protein
LYAVRSNGEVLRLDPATGAGTLVGSSGIECESGTSLNYGCGSGQSCFGQCGGIYEYMLTGAGPGPQVDQIQFLSRWSGSRVWTVTTSGRPPGYSVCAMVALDDTIIVALRDGSQPGENILAQIYRWSGAYTVIGPMGRGDVTALSWGPGGGLFALGSGGGGRLYTVNRTTGAATLIGEGGFGSDTGALTGADGLHLYAAGTNLRLVDSATGAATIIGPTGYTDLRGMGWIVRQFPWCYANCDCGGIPVLNVQDFSCFLSKFAAGDPYANCDQSTSAPALNVADFTCFLQKYTSACAP